MFEGLNREIVKNNDLFVEWIKKENININTLDGLYY